MYAKHNSATKTLETNGSKKRNKRAWSVHRPAATKTSENDCGGGPGGPSDSM
jgi:hypothetical protein